MVIDRKLKNTFGGISKLYDEVRPSYPKEAIDKIFKVAHLSNHSIILDIISSFEEIKLLPESFDLIVSAQAFHWVKPEVGYPKVYKLLKLGGVFVLMSNLLDFNRSRFTKDLKKYFIKYCPKYHYAGYGKNNRNFKRRIKLYTKFNKIQAYSFYNRLPYSKDKLKKLLDTFSWVATLPPKQKKIFFKQIDARLSIQKEPIMIPYETELIMAVK